MAIESQVHHRFKIFAADTVAEIDVKLREFTAQGSIDAKSIGIEYLEDEKRLIVSLGYTEGGEGYEATLASAEVGMLDLDSEDSIAALENALGEAASAKGEVICHELYVTESGATTAVFLLKA